jgi:hypothetical protein
MIRIKFFSSFCSSEDCKKNYESVNKSYLYDFYNQDYIFTSDDDYTHAIILNTAMPTLTIPKENVLGFAFEPYPYLGLTVQFIEYAIKHIGKYFIGDCNELPQPFIEHFGYMWYSSIQQDIWYKPKLMSIVFSDKVSAPGHEYRHKIVQAIINYDLPIDIYGYGCKMYQSSKLKGSFENNEPYEDYMFSICIENFESNHYFSEKIITPLLLNCNPIYLGCKNIDSYFDNILHLNGNINNDLEYIQEIINNPIYYYKKTYTQPHLHIVNLTYQLPNLISKNVL